MLIISKTARISPLCDIEDSIRGSKIIINDGTTIDSFVKIKPVGGIGDIIIGETSFINSGVVIYSGNGVRIGKNVMIAANCTLAPVNHEYHDKNQKIINQKFAPSKGGIIIKDDVWIGANSVILDGTIIEEGAVIGAHSLVRGTLEPYTVYAGNPLKIIGHRT
jgi:acetyltransferase-like isoleucine patch superfamily enzyme